MSLLFHKQNKYFKFDSDLHDNVIVFAEIFISVSLYKH